MLSPYLVELLDRCVDQLLFRGGRARMRINKGIATDERVVIDDKEVFDGKKSELTMLLDLAF